MAEKETLGKKKGFKRTSEEKTKESQGKKAELRKVELLFEAQEAREVFVAGDFNGWDPTATPMKRHKEGYWKAKLRLRPGRYEYKFLADGQWINYIRGVERVPNPFGTENMVLWVE